MNLIHNIISVCILLEISIAMRNFHFPHGYFHGHAMQHDYQHYDSYSSDGRMLRPHRKKYHHHRTNFDYSDSVHNYKWECKCSCAKCKKGKPKACCREFCSQQCGTLNNILVVPYPVPFMVLNQSEPSTTTTTTTTARTSTSTMFPQSRRTLGVTASTLAFYATKFKRFRIIQDKNMRRNMDNDLRSPKFERLPKYGIVPIPEKLAISLMQQIRDDQKKNQLRQRLSLSRNILDYGELPIV